MEWASIVLGRSKLVSEIPMLILNGTRFPKARLQTESGLPAGW